jgi:hypothetical protein
MRRSPPFNNPRAAAWDPVRPGAPPAALPAIGEIVYNRSMSIPLPATKLYIPAPPPKVVPRPHLIARLNTGLQRKLMLIEAPAGFGKTTLVSARVRVSYLR